NRAVDILLPDATHMCGGITEWRKIAVLADAYRLPVAAHIGDSAHVHAVAAVPSGLIVEIFIPRGNGYCAHQKTPLRRPDAKGNVRVPPGAGFGAELDEEYIRKHLV